jgi:hypothetical protein
MLGESAEARAEEDVESESLVPSRLRSTELDGRSAPPLAADANPATVSVRARVCTGLLAVR